MGRRDNQGRRELPDLGRAVARVGRALARPGEGRRRARQRRARPARQTTRREHRQRRRRDRCRQARFAVPDRCLPDRLGHVDEHERQRGDRRARRLQRASQRPRQHGPVLQRRVSLGRPPRGARCRPERAAAGAAPAGALVCEEGEELSERRQVRAHAPDGRRPGHARAGVRRLRRADRARPGARAVRAGARRADPARRHRHRHRAEHPPQIRREGPRAAEEGIRLDARSPRRWIASRRRPAATRSSSSPAR